jgi:hypothetical protein
VPSGVWARSEYAKLVTYDGEMPAQLEQGGVAIFMCHQRDGHLCAGWIVTHGAQNLLALRLTTEKVARSVYSYVTQVPVFRSGKQAAAHGMRAVKRPGIKAQAMIARLARLRARQGW